MAATQLDIAREALAQIGTRSTITSLSDGSAEAAYVSLLFEPIRDFLLVDGDYDWSMAWALLVPHPGTTIGTWKYNYTYPAEALRIRQLTPNAIFDPLDPRPIEWNVSGVSSDTRVILTMVPAEYAIITKGVDTAYWDGMFRQSFVRMLASALAFALENRIEASKVKLDEALGFAGLAKLRDM